MKVDSRNYEAPYNPVFDEDEYHDSVFLHMWLLGDDPIREVNQMLKRLPRKVRKGYKGSFIMRGKGSRRKLELAIDEIYKSQMIDALESMGYTVDIEGESYLLEPEYHSEEDSSLEMKIETLKGGMSLFEEDYKNATSSNQKAYFKGMMAAFDASIRGLKMSGVERTLEEITVNLKPNAINNFEVLHDAGIQNNTFYYNVGKIAGYDEILDYLSEFGVEIMDMWASENNKREDVEVDVNIITPKEAKLNIWIPLMVGFIGGTFATVLGNIWSEMWLNNKGHSRNVEVIDTQQP